MNDLFTVNNLLTKSGNDIDVKYCSMRIEDTNSIPEILLLIVKETTISGRY